MQRATSSRKTFTAFYSAVATALPGSAASQVPRSYPHHQRPQLRDLHRDHAVQGDGMKLLTHNMMKSHVKGISNGYPLIIRVSIVDSYTKDTHSHSQRSQLTYSNLFDGSIFDRKWWLHTAVATVRCTYAAPPLPLQFVSSFSCNCSHCTQNMYAILVHCRYHKKEPNRKGAVLPALAAVHGMVHHIECMTYTRKETTRALPVVSVRMCTHVYACTAKRTQPTTSTDLLYTGG